MKTNTENKSKSPVIWIVALLAVIALLAGMLGVLYWRSTLASTTMTIKNGLSAYELAVQNGYSGTVQEWITSLSGKSAYEIAKDNGYEGSESEWAAALNTLVSNQIVGIKTASFNSKGQLVLTLSDDTAINLGNAVGVDGKDGANGKDGADGVDGKDGADGVDGKDGVNGVDGIGITDVDINDDGELVLTFSDAETVNLGKVVGINGQNGLSAYEIAVLTGKTTAETEAEWIQSLKGEKGDTGAQGTAGDTPYINNGNWWIGEEDTEVAVTGRNGTNGEDGKTPEIGDNGNWWIDGEDTGETAVAQDGAEGDGIVGVTVDENNYLVIDMKYGEDIIIEQSIVGAAGKDGENGKDGNGIKSITLTEDYKLVIETDNGTTTLGPVLGEKGETGAKGTGIKSIALNDDFELVFTMDDEAATTHTVTGSLKGADGVGVEEVKIENGILMIKYSNSDTFEEIDTVKGEKGDKGDTGATGDQGPQGDPGKDGRGIDNVEIIDGHLWITYTDDLDKPIDVGKGHDG